MSTGTVELEWVREELFVGRDRYGGAIVIGSNPLAEEQYRGLKASDLLLLSLISCSAYDVATILRKQRQHLMSLRVLADGDQEDDPPFRFTKIHIRYKFMGRNLNENSIRRAIELSENRYCAVFATLRGAVELSSSYEIEAE
jgi:putative redox protein